MFCRLCVIQSHCTIGSSADAHSNARDVVERQLSSGGIKLQYSAPSALPRKWRTALWMGVALFLMLLVLRVYRASIENSITVDETFALMLTSHPYPEILELTRVDQHPPGYYVILKAWHQLGRVCGIPASLLWSRLPGVAAWILLVVATCWWAARRFDAVAALLLAAAVCGSCAAADVASKAGIYAIPVIAIFVMFLLLMNELARETPGTAPPRPWTRNAALPLYVVSGAVSLWVHLLSGLVIALFAIVWMTSALVSLNRRRRFTRAAIAHVGIALLFLPWAVGILKQLSAFTSDQRAWTTPATILNLLRVFSVWYPFGAMGETTDWIRPWHLALGTASFALPLFFAIVAVSMRRGPARSNAELLGWTALGIALANVLILWTLHRLGVARTWHGPRYPVFTASLWAAGLAGLSVGASQRLRWPIYTSALVLLPWFTCCALGQWGAVRLEHAAGLSNLQKSVATFPKPDDTVFVMPSELMPYHRKLLRPLKVRPIEQLFDVPGETTRVAVLNLNPWPGTDKLSNVFLRAVINSGRLSQHHESQKIPNEIMGYTLHWLSGYRRETAAQMKSYNLAPPPAPFPPGALSVAHAQDQRRSDGWSGLNATTSLYTTRIAHPPVANLHFRHAVPAGKYTLHLVAEYFATAGTTGQIILRPEGESFSHRVPSTPGSISIHLPIQLSRSHDPLVLDVIPPETGSAGPTRPELHFFFAWLEKA